MIYKKKNKKKQKGKVIFDSDKSWDVDIILSLTVTSHNQPDQICIKHEKQPLLDISYLPYHVL